MRVRLTEQGRRLLCRVWDGEAVCYDGVTGHTHHLGSGILMVWQRLRDHAGGGGAAPEGEDDADFRSALESLETLEWITVDRD